MPKLSIVIPTYNSAKYLSETIDSAIAQDFLDFEVLVVDDCSTDNTKEIVLSYVDNRIKYLSLITNHGGPSRARNIGIKSAVGEFVALCDSDDICAPGRFQDAVDFLNMEKSIGMVFTDELKFNEETGANIGNFLQGYDRFKLLPKLEIAENFFVIKSNDAFSCLFFENFILPSGVVLRKEAVEHIGYFDESLTNGDDKDMWFRMTRNYPIGFINKIGCRYRVRVNSISRRGYSLAENRIKVLQHQLDLGLSVFLRKRCLKMIAINYYGIGHHFQSLGEMSSAREYYLRSLKASLNLSAMKGLFISLLGKRIYFYLKIWTVNELEP